MNNIKNKNAFIGMNNKYVRDSYYVSAQDEYFPENDKYDFTDKTIHSLMIVGTDTRNEWDGRECFSGYVLAFNDTIALTDGKAMVSWTDGSVPEL